MIGLSLSFCVQDIIEGRVREDDVERIISGTMVDSGAQWAKVFASYATTYWRADPTLGVEIAMRLIREGKVDQPKLYGVTPFSTAGGHWLERIPSWPRQRPLPSTSVTGVR